MADEPRIPHHRFYAKQNHVQLARMDKDKSLIRASGIARIDGISTPPITGTSPILAALVGGELLSANVTWGGPYTGTGAVTVVKQMQRNGASWTAYVGATVVLPGETWQVRELASDTVTTDQPFTSAQQVVAASPPITGTSPVLAALVAGETLGDNVTWGSYSGTGSIGVTQQQRQNSGAWSVYNGASVMIVGATWQVRELVSDDLIDDQEFLSNIEVVSAAAPAAVLSNLAYANDTLSVTTDTATGLIYYLLHDSVTPLDGPAIKAAVDGLTAVGGGTADPAAAGIIPIDWTEVTPGGYWINMVQDTGSFSNVEVLQATILAAFDLASIAALMWDASDLTTLFQDTAGATPVTTTGQAVARLNNRGTKGGFFQNTGAADRPIFTVESGLNHLLFDGSNDYLRWVGASGSLSLAAGYYLIAGLSDINTVAFNGFMSASALSNTSFNQANGMMMAAGNVTNHSVGMNGGVTGTSGIEGYDTSTPGVRLPTAVVEIEVVPATGAVNAWLRVRRAGNPIVVERATDTATADTFPNTGTTTAVFILGARIGAGNPTLFASEKLHCGLLVLGAVTAQQKADCRAWVAARIGF